MEVFKEIIAIFMTIVSLTIAEEIPGVDSKAKKAATLVKIKTILADPNGLRWPPLLNGYEDIILGAFIDAAVNLLNKTGVFTPDNQNPAVPIVSIPSAKPHE